MEQLAKYSWLDQYLDAVDTALGFMDLSTLQPTSWRHFQPLIAKEWLDWFWQIVQARERQGVSYAQLAALMPAGLMRDHLIFTFEDLKSARWPKEKRLKAAEFIFEVIKAGAQGDYFGLNGTNPTYSSEQVQQIMSREFMPGSREVARAQGKFYNAAYNLGAALYLDFYMGNAIQTSGPYRLVGGKILVEKEAMHMRPLELWPELTTAADNVKIYAVYKDVKFSVDLVTCHTQFEGDALAGLQALRIEKDGVAVQTIEEIDALTQNLAENGKQQWQRVMALPEQQLLRKAVWIRCYVFKPICQLLGLDWKPSKELLQAVEGKTLEQGWKTWKQPTQEKKFKAYWRKMLDPREDFYP